MKTPLEVALLHAAGQAALLAGHTHRQLVLEKAGQVLRVDSDALEIQFQERDPGGRRDQERRYDVVLCYDTSDLGYAKSAAEVLQGGAGRDPAAELRALGIDTLVVSGYDTEDLSCPGVRAAYKRVMELP